MDHVPRNSQGAHHVHAEDVNDPGGQATDKEARATKAVSARASLLLTIPPTRRVSLVGGVGADTAIRRPVNDSYGGRMKGMLMAGFVAVCGALTLGSQPMGDPDESHIVLEQARLRAHFDSVLGELRSRDVSRLTTDQRAARSELTTWLAEYRDAGRFPLNDRYSDSLTPIFRDARGVTCAMAYLIERSGRRDIVDRISSTRNLGYLRDLADDTSLAAWLVHAGLTADEAARIQPAYPGQNEPNRLALASVTVVMSGLSVATAASNIMRPSELKGFIGMAVGGIAVLGAAALSQTHSAFASVNAVSGSAAVLAGFYAAFRPRPSAPSREARHPARNQMEIVPVAAWAPEARAGKLGLNVRF